MKHRIGYGLSVMIGVAGIVLQPHSASCQHLQIGGDIDGEAEADNSGFSVSSNADGSMVAIGAPDNSQWAGHVRVYAYQAGAWTQIGDDIDGEDPFDGSGRSVSLSADGSVVAIGAQYDSGAGTLAGQVRVFSNQSGVWTQIGNDLDGEAASDEFGTSVCLSADGTVVAAGAPRNDDAGSNAGHVRVFENQSGDWVQVGSDIDGESAGDLSGTSVTLSADGSVIAIGASTNDGAGSNSGHVRVFGYSAGDWVQIGNDIDGEFFNDLSGTSVSLSADGSVVAIGAPRNWGGTTDAGHVRVFGLQSDAWIQIGGDIDGESAGDRSGYSVDLSADGSVVAIGGYFNDGSAADSGHVRIHELDAGIWTQVGSDIDGESAGDHFGWSVDLAADGTRIAIGAPYNDDSAEDAGHVRVVALDIATGRIFADGFESGDTEAWSGP